jgi:serine protease
MMRRLLILGLLLLTACPEESEEDPPPDKNDPFPTSPPAAGKGRVQGKLTPFQSGGRSVADPPARPPPLQGANASKLSQALSRALSQKKLSTRKAAIEVSLPDLPIVPPPVGPPPLKRLPATEPVIAGDVIVRFEQAGLSAPQALERVALPGYRAVHKGYASEHLHLVGFEATDGHAVTVAETAQLVEALALVPGVRFTEKNLRMYPYLSPNDKNYSVQWHYPALNMPAAWDVTTGNANVTVAVIDTGIVNHPDLSARIVGGYDMISDTANAGDGNGRDSDPTDKGGDEPNGGSSWHGTHVSGTIGAATNNTSGVAGVTWATKIVPVRALGKQGGSSFDIAAAMTWATGGTVSGLPANANPAKVVNMSLGGAAPPQKTYQDVIDARVAAGAIFIIASGNENTDATSSTPCNQQNIICVGSTNFAGKRSSFSNYGTPVDVMAAGGEMREDLNGDGYADGVLSTSFDDNNQPIYAFNQGTSMATPHVAGVVALMAAASPTPLTSAQAESILKTTASASSKCTLGCGAGLVNAQAAVKMAQGGTSTEPPKLGVSTSLLSYSGSTTQQVLLSNLGGGSLRVTAAKSGPSAAAVSLPTATVTIPAFSTQTLDVAVNTGGLANGEYAATITLAGTNATGGAAAGTATVSVKIVVGAPAAQLDAVVAFAWQDALGEWQVTEDTITLAQPKYGYAYSIDMPPQTAYYALATIDDDQDDEFFEDGERTGFWRNVDDFEGVPLAAQQTVTNISFDLVPLAPVDDTPTLVVGAPCTSNADCLDGGRCVTGYPGGYCTRDCNSQACPSGSKCYVVDSSTGERTCIATCTGIGQGQSTCRTNYVCYDDEAGSGQCLPRCTVLNVCEGSSFTCNTSNGYCE